MQPNKKWSILLLSMTLAACGESPINNNHGAESAPNPAPNLGTAEQDLDADGAPDEFDNCPHMANAPDIFPLDGDDQQIECEVSANCLDPLNPDTMLINGQPRPEACNDNGCAPVGVFCFGGVCSMQSDFPDLDGFGNACDENDDNDNFSDGEDLCPELVSADNENNDGADDGGNACDLDDDNDGVSDVDDNCPFVPNGGDEGQQDDDGDALGDACDPFHDCDGDGLQDAPGACDMDDPADSDADGDPDDADCDDHNPDRSNLDPEVGHCADEIDNDCDNLTDGDDPDCDPDTDDDGVLNDDDNCPAHVNPGQENSDGDDLGDACDDYNCALTNGGVEACDGLDNDCDGDTDEDFLDLGDACSAGMGECMAAGVMVCNVVGDGTVCNAAPGEPGVEACDGLDNDCDGAVDNGVLNACGLCGAVPAEACGNDLDDDCDMAVDEGCDDDADGIIDDMDNCPGMLNPYQGDRDGNGVGNVCDNNCEDILMAAAGTEFEHAISVNVDGDGFPLAPWDQSDDQELCIYDGETALFNATDGEDYALSDGDPCVEANIVEAAGFFLEGYGPGDTYVPVCTENGPDYLGTAEAVPE